MERRIAAIVAADMVGWSRLMEADEAGTLDRQKRHFAELIEPAMARHNGRIIKTTGDGLIAEFPSVVDAVQCTIHIQKEMVAREQDQPEDRRILYRIAVNLGDVIFDDDDVYGDGVNIAARLEALAEPGGVVVSGEAYDHLKAKVDVGYVALGEKRLKNIATPVRVYQVTEEGAPAPQRRRSRSLVLVAVAACLVAVAVGLGWWLTRPDFTPANPDNFAYTLPEKPSIAVLPFDNLSGDTSQEWLADGFTETLIALLATSPEMFVIARNSTFTYKGKPVKVQQVAEELGVRYVLEGSVQRSGEKLRITAQLVDALNGHHLWSNRYDRTMDDIFAVQDAVTQDILAALEVQTTLGEYAKILRQSSGSPEMYARLVKAKAISRAYSVEAWAAAVREIAPVLVVSA